MNFALGVSEKGIRYPIVDQQTIVVSAVVLNTTICCVTQVKKINSQID